MKKVFFTTLLCVCSFLHGKVVPAAVFSNNMVLQRDRNVPVWGVAAPGEDVTVKFAGQSVSAKADAKGCWHAVLAPMKADSKGRTMIISGKNNSITVSNVLVGEVWLCSGQSNMEMPMWTSNPRWRAAGGDKHVKSGADPLIRIVKMSPYGWSHYPRRDFVMKWSPLTADNGLSFSATAFYFGQELRKVLGVPVGLIASHWGGTRIEPWIPAEGYRMVPELKKFADSVYAKIPGSEEYKKFSANVLQKQEKWLVEFKKALKAGLPLPPAPAYPEELVPWSRYQNPTVLYNRMIFPFVPFAFRGAIWYQGCSNLGDGLYGYKMQALLKGWRKVFNNPDMAFYFVQLAPFRYGGNPLRLPEMWEVQERFANSQGSNVKMAVINDVGDWGDIHPHDKKTVGKRLSLLALRHSYGKPVKADSPQLASWKIEGKKFILEFRNVEKWLAPKVLKGFEAAGVDNRFFPATAVLDGKKIIVSCEKVAEPVQMRYLWHQTVKGAIFNEAGLPLGAFRCGKTLDEVLVSRLAPQAKLVYSHDMLSIPGADKKIKYAADKSGTCKGKVKKVLYIVHLTPKKGGAQWVAAAMESFTPDAGLIGVPEKAKAFFDCKVKALTVLSNVPGIKNGSFREGNIEFWNGNYAMDNRKNIPGADSKRYDFGDSGNSAAHPGYGSMQIHNFMEKQTVFAYNNFFKPVKDIGIGNNPNGYPDWTFAGSSKNYSKALLKVYAEFE